MCFHLTKQQAASPERNKKKYLSPPLTNDWQLSAHQMFARLLNPDSWKHFCSGMNSHAAKQDGKRKAIRRNCERAALAFVCLHKRAKK
mmetsp:Transcript_41648/g.89423  ORF Transcript_41648/g.89423 Transcript_41648/m.89423 type:complete len:88 (+) Transcript_41648:387-650(+)